MFAVSNASKTITAGLNLESGNTGQVWFWQRGKKKKKRIAVTYVLRHTETMDSCKSYSHRIPTIHSWFLASYLPPGIEKSQSWAV